MSSDPNKKSPRTFQCRDVLWETFEQMARELECSVDYLVNESMKQYARQRSYGARAPYAVSGREGAPSDGRLPAGSPQPPPAGPPSRGTGAPSGGAPFPPPPSRVPPPNRPPSVNPMPHAALSGAITGSNAVTGQRAPLPAPPQRQMQTLGGTGPGGLPSVPARGGMPAPPRSVPPPLPRAPTPVPPQANNGYASPHGSTLAVIYNGEKLSIAKDRFVIGRGKQSSDLTLKDPNVSRQHAMVEFQNGVYFMVDMGSTNGVEYNGQRIARKQISEGDVFRICDHDLFFTYR